jgi:uncharacterized membrane protein YkvA (DUF1232 family)
MQNKDSFPKQLPPGTELLPPEKPSVSHNYEPFGERRKFPWMKLGLLALALLLYTASPLDLIPDFIPVLGQLDDLVVDTGLIAMILRTVYQYYRGGRPQRVTWKHGVRGMLLQRALRWVFSK